MRLYKVSMDGDFANTDGMSRWTSKLSEIPRLKRELREACLDKGSRPEPSVEALDIIQTRDGLVVFLNKHAVRG